MDDLIERLRTRLAAERAAPETGHNAADRERAELIRLLRDAAAALEAAREDAERYRWLRMMAKEQLLNPKAAASECPDMRTYWRIPTLICSGPVGGFIDFDAAIDAAREARNG